MLYSVHELCVRLDGNEGWTELHNRWVPRFQHEAISKANWQDWEPEVLEELLYKRRNCVSSLRAGYFSRSQIQLILDAWAEVGPMLKQMAQSPDTFLGQDFYDRFDTTLLRITTQKGNAMYSAVHRLAAALQPNVFSTVCSSRFLGWGFALLHKYAKGDIPKYTGNWYIDSHAFLELVHKAFPEAQTSEQKLALMAYPWSLCEQAENICRGKISIEEAFASPSEQSTQNNELVEKLTQDVRAQYNIILHGAPGTGKTFLARSIADSLTDGKAENMAFVQFHPSYDYSDFMEGLKPVIMHGQQGGIGFERKDGVLKALCRKAVAHPDDSFVLIIDEINRGALSRIFGEAFCAIDPGWRVSKDQYGDKSQKVDTQYQALITDPADPFKDGFFMPDNVYVIGTMNDIDRSVESMDFAMRRRFTFIEITPEDTAYMLDDLPEAYREQAKNRMQNLNEAISGEQTILNKSYAIGGAYFLKLRQYADSQEQGSEDVNGAFAELWQNNLQPLLTAYLSTEPSLKQDLEALKKAYDTTSAKEG